MAKIGGFTRKTSPARIPRVTNQNTNQLWASKSSQRSHVSFASMLSIVPLKVHFTNPKIQLKSELRGVKERSTKSFWMKLVECTMEELMWREKKRWYTLPLQVAVSDLKTSHQNFQFQQEIRMWCLCAKEHCIICSTSQSFRSIERD